MKTSPSTMIDTQTMRRVSYYEIELSSLQCDERSEASTISRDANNDSCKKRKQRRCVRFEAIDIHEYEGVHADEHASTWYSADELDCMKRDVKRVCRRRDLENPLNEVYAMSLPSDVQANAVKDLVDNEYFEEQRGLERFSSRMHTLSRGLTVLQVKSEVFLQQAQMALKGSAGQESDVKIAQACAAASAPAAKFAQIMGQIDAIAARRDR
jgi:hypothetical protein